MWKIIAERGGPQMTVWHIRIACWITKTTHTHTHTHTEYAILIAFPRQKWLRACISMSCFSTLPVMFSLIVHGAKHTKKNVGKCSRITLVLEDCCLGRERQCRLCLLLYLGKLELIILVSQNSRPWWQIVSIFRYEYWLSWRAFLWFPSVTAENSGTVPEWLGSFLP
jgi:hypothetical protein